jgi:hypothetical protein
MPVGPGTFKGGRDPPGLLLRTPLRRGGLLCESAGGRAGPGQPTCFVTHAAAKRN